jgi:hypothetical protein
MNENVCDCLVTDYQWIIPTLNLPDTDDRHVLAAAIKARAEVIVTTNLRDFPQSELDKYNIEAQHQDTFITNLIDLHPVQVIEAVKKCHDRRKNPPCSFEEYLVRLQKQELPRYAHPIWWLLDSTDLVCGDSLLLEDLESINAKHWEALWLSDLCLVEVGNSNGNNSTNFKQRIRQLQKQPLTAENKYPSNTVRQILKRDRYLKLERHTHFFK